MMLSRKREKRVAGALWHDRWDDRPVPDLRAVSRAGGMALCARQGWGRGYPDGSRRDQPSRSGMRSSAGARDHGNFPAGSTLRRADGHPLRRGRSRLRGTDAEQPRRCPDPAGRRRSAPCPLRSAAGFGPRFAGLDRAPSAAGRSLPVVPFHQPRHGCRGTHFASRRGERTSREGKTYSLVREATPSPIGPWANP
jgi:hypothetical protein